ncbi:MAG: PAS domain S-box protein, partial [Alphaproteobacteria bacterium]|nr:PAS domain S-box protein [Alphaproteobacteria bacterium]
MPSIEAANSRIETAALAGACSAAVLAGSALVAPTTQGPLLTALGAAIAAGSFGLSFYGARRKRDPAWLGAVAKLFDPADQPRIVSDATGRVLYANPAARYWFKGEDPFAVLERTAARDFEGRDGVARLRQAVAAGVALYVDVAVQKSAEADIEPEWFRIVVSPLGADAAASRAEQVAGLSLWRFEDITAERVINDTLSQERQDLADFLYLLPAGLYSADIDGTLRLVNHRLAEWLGADTDDLIGRPLDDILHGPARPQADGEWQGEVRLKTRGGEVFPALLFQSMWDDAGVTRTRTVVVRDAARRGDGQPAGRAAYERFRALFNAAPVAIAITDADGVIADCNEAFERLVGQARAALIGGALAERIGADDRRAFTSDLMRVINGEAPSAQLDAKLVVDAAGKQSQASVFLGPSSALLDFKAGGGIEIEGAVAHFIDTTEQKSLEAQFAQAQKMQAMGQLAGGVAHDFNNLLTAMIGFCDLLLQRHKAGDPSFADIMQIKQNSNRAANLVRQLLAFSRKQPLQPKNLDVTDALTELSHLLTRLIGESIDFKLVHGRDIGQVRVDPGQFDQMIINLAVNARDAMMGGGSLAIATDVETFTAPTRIGAESVPAGRYVRVTVTDSGKGIASENLARIFEPFFSTKKEVPGAGTGLGLSTVYGIVRQTGGFILVESAPGAGATFTIYLPRVAPETDEAEARPAA